MEFYLSLKGPISTTKHTQVKFQYRRYFLTQLRELQKHLCENGLPEEHLFSKSKMRHVQDFAFVPLVTKDAGYVVDLDIVLLSQSEPACLANYPTGDLDNILKALIDGLRMAQNANEVRKEKPQKGENPFYCVLEDDQIIRNIQIRHDKYLFPEVKDLQGKKEVFALIKISVVPKFPYAI